MKRKKAQEMLRRAAASTQVSQLARTNHARTVDVSRQLDNAARDDRGRTERSTAEKNEFKNEQPCPSTGKSSGACPGYVIDHVKPLCKGGADHPSNMQWQTVAEGKAKDKVECR